MIGISAPPFCSEKKNTGMSVSGTFTSLPGIEPGAFRLGAHFSGFYAVLRCISKC